MTKRSFIAILSNFAEGAIFIPGFDVIKQDVVASAYGGTGWRFRSFCLNSFLWDSGSKSIGIG